MEQNSTDLSEMVKEDAVPAGPVMFEESDLDLPAEVEVEAPETGEIPLAVDTIGIIPLEFNNSNCHRTHI